MGWSKWWGGGFELAEELATPAVERSNVYRSLRRVVGVHAGPKATPAGLLSGITCRVTMMRHDGIMQAKH